MIHRSFLGLSLILGVVRAHDHEDHHHHHSHGLRRNLASGNLFAPPGKCKDGDESFIVGGVTYECRDDFNERGGQCKTAKQTEEQKIKFDKDFAQWMKAKNEKKENKGRQLNGCGTSGCAGIEYVYICCAVLYEYMTYDVLTFLVFHSPTPNIISILFSIVLF